MDLITRKLEKCIFDPVIPTILPSRSDKTVNEGVKIRVWDLNPTGIKLSEFVGLLIAPDAEVAGGSNEEKKTFFPRWIFL